MEGKKTAEMPYLCGFPLFFFFLEIAVLGRFRPVECEKNWVLLWVLFMECSLSLCYDDFYIANAGKL